MDDYAYLLYMAMYEVEANEAQILRAEEPFKTLDWEGLKREVEAHGRAWVGPESDVLPHRPLAEDVGGAGGSGRIASRPLGKEREA
jgi:hypothetical protein